MKYNFLIFMSIIIILFYFTCSKKKSHDEILYDLELNSVKKIFVKYVKVLPKNYREQLKDVELELSEDKIGYCKDKKLIGIYRSYGKTYKITQIEVLIHEIAHALNETEKHDEKYWEIYNYLLAEGKKHNFIE